MRTRKLKQNLLSIIAIGSLLLTFLSALKPSYGIVTSKADSNPATWILCGTEDGKQIYNAATTDLIPYSLRSKSNVTKSDSIDSFFNMVLGVSGFNFAEVNKAIIGRDVINKEKAEKEKTDSKPADAKDTEANFNTTAPKVTPFDRFGMSGLHWSSYAGEWKYYEVDGCATKDEVSPTEFGKFYKNRKEPKASFNETTTSKDPRVIQYNKGTFFSWLNAFNSLLTNGLFNVAKLIVTFTIAFVGLSFSDVSSTIGLGTNNGSNGLIGLFNNLYSGFFTPLIVLAFLLTAIYMIYYGLIKRQIRQALISGLGQALGCMFLAILIGSAPAFWIPLPNRIATFGQALIISSLGTNAEKGDTLCTTNVGSINTGTVDINASHENKLTAMEKVGTEMRSVLGCRMWQEFLLKPWARGQFGTEYEDLVVAGVDGAKLQNINSEWTKTADVPLGGGVMEHNLALFQISTQSEAHAQVSDDTGTVTDPKKNIVKEVDGVSSDWWRVTDILSNYDEQKVTSTPAGGGKTVEVEERVDASPLEPWQSWIGNRQLERYNIAFLSVIFGAIGSIGPLVFGVLTALYSVGVTLLMAISPLFLLMGCWAGQGQTFFRGWLEALLSTMLKKIVSAGLLLVSFAITINAMGLIATIGWIKAFLLLALMTYIIIKNRKIILDTFAKVNLGGKLRPDQMFSNFAKEKGKWVDEGALVAQSALVGARQAKKQGMKMSTGARVAAGHQMKNTLRKSTMGRAMSVQMSKKSTGPLTCIYCDKVINDGISSYSYYLDDNQNIVCSECAIDMGMETELDKVHGQGAANSLSTSDRKELEKRTAEHNKEQGKLGHLNNQKITSANSANKNNKLYQTSNKAWLSYTKTQELINLSMDDEGKLYWDNDSVREMIEENVNRLDKVSEEYNKLWNEYGEGAVTPSVAEPIQKYVSTALIDEAWRAGNYKLVKDEVINGWADWYDDNSREIVNIEDEVIDTDAISKREKTLTYIRTLSDSSLHSGKDSQNRKSTEERVNINEIEDEQLTETLGDD